MIRQAVPSRRSIVAHRGVSAQCPENTRSAFEAAVLCDADAIEFDIQVTADDCIVICHNPVLDRYGYPQVEIATSTLAELQDLDLGRFSGERLMTLDELLLEFGSRIPLYVEFKTKDMHQRHIETLLDGFLSLTAHCHESLNLWGLCFDQGVLRQLASTADWLPLIWNTNEPHLIQADDLARQPWLSGVGCRIGHLSAPTARLIHDAGLHLFSFTCNEESDVLKARHLGVESIITDDPDQTRGILHREVHRETDRDVRSVNG